MPNRYIVCTSNARGAIAVFHLYADEPDIVRLVDARVGRRDGINPSNKLQDNALRYGWLRHADGRVVDEVLLGKTRPGMRVLMTHGGGAVRNAIFAWLAEEGFCQTTAGEELAASPLQPDPLLSPALANCVTESEVAAALSLMAGEEGELPRLRRVLLCGAPNVGKSSIFNRLCDYERAFVHDGAGATADIVDEIVDLAGYGVRLGDTPGVAPGTAAWDAARRQLSSADWLLFVCDGSAGWREEDVAAARAVCEAGVAGEVRLVAVTKSDLGCVVAGEPWREFFPAAWAVAVNGLAGSPTRRIIEEAAFRVEEGEGSTARLHSGCQSASQNE